MMKAQRSKTAPFILSKIVVPVPYREYEYGLLVTVQGIFIRIFFIFETFKMPQEFVKISGLKIGYHPVPNFRISSLAHVTIDEVTWQGYSEKKMGLFSRRKKWYLRTGDLPSIHQNDGLPLVSLWWLNWKRKLTKSVSHLRKNNF